MGREEVLIIIFGDEGRGGKEGSANYYFSGREGEGEGGKSVYYFFATDWGGKEGSLIIVFAHCVHRGKRKCERRIQ